MEMFVELVKTTTVDALRLDGALHAPRNSTGKSSVDALLCLPGVANNFYASTMLEDLLPSLQNLDLAVLWANTRGHDGLFTATTVKGTQRFGAATEIVDQCRLDIFAWCEFLVHRGYPRIGLLGHSLGALKAVYSQAFQAHQAVVRVIAASPPRLSYSCFCQGDQAAAFAETIANAERHVALGESNQLMEVRLPFPLIISASSYLDKYGPQERYNILKFANRVAVPVRFVYGAVELERDGAAFAGLPEALAALPDEGQNFSFATVPHADHMYSGRRDALADVVCRWLVDSEEGDS